jgi:hypothetical protein
VRSPIRILLQTTIRPIADDWHSGRFAMLRDHLAGPVDTDGALSVQCALV